jgi:hypothetical protein
VTKIWGTSNMRSRLKNGRSRKFTELNNQTPRPLLLRLTASSSWKRNLVHQWTGKNLWLIHAQCQPRLRSHRNHLVKVHSDTLSMAMTHSLKRIWSLS